MTISTEKKVSENPRPKNKDEHREALANMFADLLEEKQLKWKSGLKNFRALGHHNGVTKSNYNGLNVFNLWITSIVKEYDDTRWVTMNQIIDKQGKYHPNEKWHLKKGTKACYVEYWYPFDLENKKALSWDDYKKELASGRKQEDFTLRTKYTGVFNASCVEGMPQLEKIDVSSQNVNELISKLSENMNVPIIFDSTRTPCYVPSKDKIYVPHKESYESEYEFNATALHELAHATGHSSRLDRNIENSFSTKDYAYEELVAEMSACFMGINIEQEQTEEHIENHKAYVGSWIKKIKDEPDVLVKAIKDAQECAKYMDFKAGLITEQEYKGIKDSAVEVSEDEIENKELNVKNEEQETHTDIEDECQGMGFSM